MQKSESTEFETCAEEHLGSRFEITVPKKSSKVFKECFFELSRIEQDYSRFVASSELSMLNSQLGQWHKVSDEFIFLLLKSQEFYKKTDGNFDITIKSTLDQLGYDSKYSFVQTPAKKERLLSKLIQPILGAVNIDAYGKKVLLRKQIDLGGFGKGYCLDRLSHIIEQHNINDYLINAGGDILAKKVNSDDSWTILLEHPEDPTKAIGQIKLNGRAIACSAPNRRRWGKYHHLINTKTRLPQESVKCIFVVASTGIEADGYATALFTVGFEDGIALSKKLPVEMLIVSKDNKMYKSQGFDAKIYK